MHQTSVYTLVNGSVMRAVSLFVIFAVFDV